MRAIPSYVSTFKSSILSTPTACETTMASGKSSKIIKEESPKQKLDKVLMVGSENDEPRPAQKDAGWLRSRNRETVTATKSKCKTLKCVYRIKRLEPNKKLRRA